MSAEGPAFVFRLNDNGVGPELVRQVFLERGWLEYDEDFHGEDDWNFWWKTSRFRNCDYDVLQPNQRLNHYPRSTAITKKDSLARNLKRMRGVYGPGVYNFSPVAFNLPNDYTRFVAEYTKLNENGEKPYWICKPADLSRGRGIFVFQDLSELQYDCNAVVQRYIAKPMLISGYKFDLRIYVAVPSFHPLKAYVYREGLVRFSTEKFDLSCLGNLFAHLTNTSINKHSPSYSVDKERVGPGCKWTLSQLRHYFHQANLDDSLLWTRIIQIVVLTLLIQAHQAPKASNCFELYGFDVIIDEHMKPWLLEVNFSPALSSDCPTDVMVKKPMLHDLIDLLDFTEKDKIPGFCSHYYTASGPARYQSPVRTSPTKPSGSVGRLPYIGSQSSPSLMLGGACGEEGEEKEDGEESEEVVPIIPGCGLPSVQSSRHPNGSSGRSSVSSANSYSSFDSSDQASKRDISRTSNQKGSAHGSTYHQAPGFMRHKSLRHVSQQYYRTAARTDSGLQKKFSVNSDSGISMQSGSSGYSDPHSSHTEDLTLLIKDGSDSLDADKMSSKSDGTKTTMPPVKGPPHASSMGRVAVELRKEGVRLPTSSRLSVSKSSVQYKNPKRNSHSGFTANSLMGKSVPLGRRGSVPITPPHHNLQGSVTRTNRLSYARPWRSRDPVAEPRPTVQNNESNIFHPSVGDFMMVFPFNAQSRKCAQGNLDDRVVIRECQRLVKHMASKTRATSNLNAGKDLSPVADITLPWGPFKKTEEIYTH